MNKVDNRRVIKRLALREIKSGKMMNVVIALSIALTCILFTGLASIGGGLLNEIQQETMRQVGGDRMAGLKYALSDDLEKITADKATKDVIYRIIVGEAINDELKNISAEISCAGDDEAARASFCYPEAGRLPKEFDEIAMSTIVLDELGLPYELGTSVPITLNIDGQVTQHEFTLCGYWEGDMIAMAQECWVSKAFANEYAPSPSQDFFSQEDCKYAGYYNIDFNYSNSWNIEKKTNKLMQRIYGEDAESHSYGVNWAYTSSNVDTETMVGICAMLLVIFSAGYLIIYNIFHINISANIRSYGLLKTIGTTSRQIKRMVRVQACVYCAVGIPIGILTGILISKALFGPVIRTFDIISSGEFYVSTVMLVIICVLSAAFTFATVMISCRKPCKIAGNVSPIQALRFNDTNIESKKSDKKIKNVTPFSIARSNMSRSKKKTFIVVLSLTLSVVIMNMMYTLLNGLDMDKYISTNVVGDFVIKRIHSSSHDGDRFFSITPEDLEFLGNIEGTAQFDEIFYEYAWLIPSGRSKDIADTLYSKYPQLGDPDTETILPVDIYGVSDGVVEYLENNSQIDIEKFRSGKYAIVNTYCLETEDPDEERLYEVGDTVVIRSRFGAEKEYEVIAVDNLTYALSTQAYFLLGGELIIPESEYLQLTDNRSAMTVIINAEENFYDRVNSVLQSYTDHSTYLTLKNKQSYLDEYYSYIRMIKLVGGTLCGVLALIGIINFINADVTSILSRKRELAMMNAVGMTGGQLMKMLMWEGIYYALLTALCSVVLSALTSLTFMRNFINDMPIFTYHFTLLPLVVCIPILLLLSAVVPCVFYKKLCSESIIDRIREN